MSLLDKDEITDVFCMTDDFCKEYYGEIKSHKRLPDSGGKKPQPQPRNVRQRNHHHPDAFPEHRLLWKMHRHQFCGQPGIHIVTGLKSNMENRLTPLFDRIVPRKRSVLLSRPLTLGLAVSSTGRLPSAWKGITMTNSWRCSSDLSFHHVFLTAG